MIIPAWTTLAIFAAILWACVNVIDKIIITNHLNYKQIFMFSPVKIVLMLPLLFFFDLSISPFLAILAMILGVLSSFSIIFYYQALRQGEVSRLAPLFSFTPLFVGLFSAIFLSEVFTLKSYFGLFLLVLGASLISYEHSKQEKFNKKAIGFLFLSILLFAIFDVFLKHFMGFVSPFAAFFYSFVGSLIFISAVFWITEDKKEFFSKIKNPRLLALLLLSS
ncbi:MAG: GRP family sugar transporter, partial [archaeon]